MCRNPLPAAPNKSFHQAASFAIIKFVKQASVLSFRSRSRGRGISLWLFVPPAPSLPRLELQRKRCPRNQVASHPRTECLQRRQPSLFRPPPSAIGPAQGEIPLPRLRDRNDKGFSIRRVCGEPCGGRPGADEQEAGSHGSPEQEPSGQLSSVASVCMPVLCRPSIRRYWGEERIAHLAGRRRK